MGKSAPKIPVDAFKMSIQYGICSGIVDWLHRLIVKDKVIWSGRKCGPDALFIDSPRFLVDISRKGALRGLPTSRVGPTPNYCILKFQQSRGACRLRFSATVESLQSLLPKLV